MPKLPGPRRPLPDLRAGDTAVLRRGTRIWRVYRAEGDHAVSWSTFRHHGPVATGRFDHQEPPLHEDAERAILYGALDAPAAFAEAFQDTRLIDRVRDGPWLACFELAVDAPMLDLTGSWPTRAGASQAIATGRRDRAQAWSREIHAAYPTIAGLVYPSAWAGASVNVALYERAAGCLPSRPILNMPLLHPGLEVALNRVADRFGYGLR